MLECKEVFLTIQLGSRAKHNQEHYVKKKSCMVPLETASSCRRIKESH
jgi:hypothetical protein